METVIRKNQKGFTLAELLVAMAGSLLVLAVVGSVFRMQAHTVKAQEYKMEAQEYARNALDMMTREIRNAGFFPNGACPQSVNNGLVQATSTTLQIVYDADSNVNCTGTMATGQPADENVTYALAGGDITRTVTGATPQAAQLTSGTGNITNAVLFTYFDANGADLGVNPPLATIKRVRVTITVQSRSTDSQFNGSQFNGGQAQTITMTSNVDLRNRCIPAPCTQM